MKERDIYYWLELVWRRRRIAALVALIVFTLIFVVSILLPPLYESSAEILVQANRAHYLVSPALQTSNDANAPIVNDREVTEQDLNSEIELLTQPQLVEQALEDLDKREPPEGFMHYVGIAGSTLLGLPGDAYRILHGAPPLTSVQSRALAIESRVNAAAIRRSNMIEVSFRSHHADWAREFLSALTNRYLALHAQIAHDARSAKFFEEQSNALKERLDESERKLRDVRQRTGILSLNDQNEAMTYQLSGFQAEYRKNQSRLEGVSEQIAALEAGMKTTPARLLKEVKQAPNPAYQTLKPKVLEIEMNRDDILQRYQPQSKQAQAIVKQVANAESLLAKQDRTQIAEQVTDVNPVWLGLASNLAQARVTASALARSQQGLAQQIDTYKDELKQLAGDGIEVDRAMREVEANKEAYISYVRKGEEARAEAALNQSRITNVVLAMQPSQPLEPVFPKLGLNLAVGLILAIIAGFGVAWWEESNDPMIYSGVAIFESTSIPVVAMIRTRTPLRRPPNKVDA